MAIILDDVERLDRLITDISDASRLDAELSRDELAPVDIAAMLRALVDVHEATRADRRARVSCSIFAERGRPLVVVGGSKRRLSQVFRNVIANAVSFSPPQGEIRLTARRARPRRSSSYRRGWRPGHSRGQARPRFSTASTPSAPPAKNSARIPGSGCRSPNRSSRRIAA